MDKRIKLGMALLGFLCASLLLGALGGWLTSFSVKTWYPLTAKPSWTPPDSVFAPVWTFLYLTIGTSAWLIWKENGFSQNSKAWLAFGSQLALNVLWSALFFTLQSPLLGMICIVPMWGMIAATIFLFYQIDKWAGLILIPYWLWVGYAAALTIAIWSMNG